MFSRSLLANRKTKNQQWPILFTTMPRLPVLIQALLPYVATKIVAHAQRQLLGRPAQFHVGNTCSFRRLVEPLGFEYAR